MNTLPESNDIGRKKHNRRQNIISAIILAGGTLLAFLLFGTKNSQTQENEEISTPPVVVKTLILGEAESQRARLEKTVTLQSAQSAEVVAEYSGKITEVRFDVGKKVARGETLAIFDQSDRENAPKIALQTAVETLDVAKDNLKRTKIVSDESVQLAKGAVDVAEEQLDQAKDLDNSNAEDIAEKQLDIAKDQEDQARELAEIQINNTRLQVAQAEAQLRQARVAYGKTIIRAPISGTVATKNVREGDFKNFGESIAHIVGGGTLETTVFLNQIEISRVRAGDEVEVAIDGNLTRGRIISLSQAASDAVQRFGVSVQIDGDIPFGANRTAQLVFHLRLDPSRPESFFVPLEAVIIGQQKREVFMAEDGTARAREVGTGEIIGNQIEITSGVQKGEELVIEGNRNLQDGQAVQIQ